MPALSITGLEVRFPGLERPALDVPALSLPAGAQIAITGPSGCGKTTLLNILTGLERAGKGRIAWGDTDLATLSEGRRDAWRASQIGLMMQDFHLFPGLSAVENVLLPQRLSRLRLPPGMAEAAASLLGHVGIARLDQSVETMSRGQMQRVAVARALVGRPAIVVADEPTASLDAEAGAAVAALLIDLTAESGATLIVASHDPLLLGRMNRVLRLDRGRISAALDEAA